MPYSRATNIYKSQIPKASLPTEPLSLFEFMFEWESTPALTNYEVPVHVQRQKKEGSTWLIDSITGRTLTFEGARERTLDIARGLHSSYGLGEDDTLVLFSGNEVDYPTTIWASFRLGAIVSAANPAYGASELSYQLKLVHAHHPVKVIVVHPDSLATALEAAKQTGLPASAIVLIYAPGVNATDEAKALAKGHKTLDDIVAGAQGQLPSIIKLTPENRLTKLAFLSFSSGTTGLPKAVQIPHASVIANILQTTHHYNSTSSFKRYDSKTKTGDVISCVLPMFHIYSLVVVTHVSLFNCTPIVTLNRFTLKDFLESIQRWKITCLYVVPPIVIQMVKDESTRNYDLTSVRIGMTGAAPLSAETSAAFAAKYPKIVFGQGYGMTESATIIAIFDASVPSAIDGASAGVLAPNVEAKIIAPDGRALGPGEVGELISRSPSNAIGYLGNEKATKETWDADGFLHTGDECYISRGGMLYVVDRLKELIKVNGNQVAPADLEGHLLAHPDVLNCAVIGVPDDRAGERPKAYVVLSIAANARVANGESSLEQVAAGLKKHVADHKISYKHLHYVEFIDAIPMTASGKLLRKDLRVRHAASVKAAARL